MLFPRNSSSELRLLVRESWSKKVFLLPLPATHPFSTNSIKQSPVADVSFEGIGEIWESGTQFLPVLCPLLFMQYNRVLVNLCCTLEASFMVPQMCSASQQQLIFILFKSSSVHISSDHLFKSRFGDGNQTLEMEAVHQRVSLDPFSHHPLHCHPRHFIVQAILNIDIILIVPIADGEDGGPGQRSPAVQHHLLPLLPGHHRLPGTASQQVPAQKSF